MKYPILFGCLLILLPYSLSATTSGTNAATNTIVTRVASGAFTADGINTAGEYSDPDDVVDVAGSDFMEAKVFLHRTRDAMTGDEELRIYFSVHDIDSNSGDHIDFYFDRRHDHGSLATTGPLAEDIRLRIERVSCSGGACVFDRLARDSATNFFIGTPTGVPFANAEVQASNVGEWSGADPGFQDGWTGEFVLTPADLGWGTFPPVIGFLAVAESQGSNGINAGDGIGAGGSPAASYPLSGGSVVDQTQADDWANLKLRYPIDYALVLDFSGSMLATDTLTDNRWVRAKRAADLFVAGLGLVNDDTCGGGSCFDDNIYASQYSWSCSDDTALGDTTGGITGVSLGPTSIPTPPVGTSSFMGNWLPGSGCLT